jgi:hypothetical protein
MQQFTVPQFIDVEDKVIGPITVRQFIIMLAGFLAIAVCYKLLDFTAFVVFGFIIFGITGIFAFVRVNGMPFHFFVLNFMQTSSRPFLRVWNNAYRESLVYKEEEEEQEKTEAAPVKPKRVTTSRLAELSLIVDTQGVYKGEEGGEVEIKTNVEEIKRLTKR